MIRALQNKHTQRPRHTLGYIHIIYEKVLLFIPKYAHETDIFRFFFSLNSNPCESNQIRSLQSSEIGKFFLQMNLCIVDVTEEKTKQIMKQSILSHIHCQNTRQKKTHTIDCELTFIHTPKEKNQAKY